jgi:hypothetical protein
MDDFCKPSSVRISRPTCSLYACYILIDGISSGLLELSGKVDVCVCMSTMVSAIGTDLIVDSVFDLRTCYHQKRSLSSCIYFRVRQPGLNCHLLIVEESLHLPPLGIEVGSNSHVYERWTCSIIVCIVVSRNTALVRSGSQQN